MATAEYRMSISGDLLDFTIGSASVQASVSQIDQLIKALEGVRHMLGGAVATPAVLAPAAPAISAMQIVAPAPPAAPMTSAPAAAAPPIPAPVGRPPGRPPKTGAQTTKAPGAKKKRRSRKRVGDALVIWMGNNPGWHTEADLVAAVIEHEMTDASPKRALKIALGKQRGEVFEGDGDGNWKLSRDRSPGGAPGKPSGGHKARPLSEPVKLRSPGARPRRSKRLKTRTGRDTEADSRPATPTSAPTEGGAEAEADSASARTVLVKRGQNRKDASLAPGELEAREEASSAIENRRQQRWTRTSSDAIERARRNLLGLGTAPGGSDS